MRGICWLPESVLDSREGLKYTSTLIHYLFQQKKTLQHVIHQCMASDFYGIRTQHGARFSFKYSHKQRYDQKVFHVHIENRGRCVRWQATERPGHRAAVRHRTSDVTFSKAEGTVDLKVSWSKCRECNSTVSYLQRSCGPNSFFNV